MAAPKEKKTSNRLPYKYDSKYHDPWVFSLAIKGATDEEIAEAMGISRRTVMRWSVAKDDRGDEILTSFGEARLNGKEQADAKVVKKLFDLCMGYEVEEVERTLEHDKFGKPIIRETLIKSRHIPPNVMAIMYWLNNRSRKTGEWTQKQELNLTIGEEQQDVIIMLPDNGRGRPETDKD